MIRYAPVPLLGLRFGWAAWAYIGILSDFSLFNINRMTEFKAKYSLTNGNKLTKKNWKKVVAVSSEPNITNQGWPEIERQKKENGAYYNKWILSYEEGKGYIFTEITTGSGINGFHESPKAAIWEALQFDYISVYLKE